MHIVLTGGGTGGHVAPQLALIEKISADPATADWRLTYVGSRRGIEAQWIPPTGMPFVSVAAGKLRRYFSWRNLLSPFEFVQGFLQATLWLARHRPSAVFSSGGYVAMPVVSAAALLRIPVVVHEQTTVMGRANRFAARLAKRVLLSFADTRGVPAGVQTEVVGNPVRRALGGVERPAALQTLGLSPDLPVVYVTGGAQGAHFLNEAVGSQLATLLTAVQLIVVTGPNRDHDRLGERAAGLPAALRDRLKLFPLLGAELPAVYAAADLVVGRAGAGTVNELRALGKPSLLVPLPASAGGEQQRNAAQLAATGGAVVVTQAETSASALVDQILALVHDGGRLASMRRALQAQPGRDAADRIIRILAEAGGGFVGGAGFD